MSAHFIYSLSFVSLAIFVKLFVFFSNNQYNADIDTAAMYANMLFLLFCVFFTLRSYKKRESHSQFLDDVKTCGKAVALYALVMASYNYTHYRFVDSEYLNTKITERMELAQQVDESILLNHPKGYSKEEFLENELKMTQFIFSAFNHASFTLFGYLLMGILYTIILVVLVRSFPLILFT